MSLGLQHVIEFWSGNKSVFWCDLCEVSCSNAQGVIAHAVGRQHRTNYMVIIRPRLFALGLLF